MRFIRSIKPYFKLLSRIIRFNSIVAARANLKASQANAASMYVLVHLPGISPALELTSAMG